MNFEAIETAFELLLENVQTIENDLGTHAYDALIEQNSYYLGAEVANELIIKNNEKLRALNLSKEEWRRAFQFFVYQTRAIGSFTSQSPIYTGCYWIYHSLPT
mgnify:CR=1 FL=1